MFDFVRNWTKTEEEKRQETLHAYLDDALSPVERQRFEQQLAQDAALRAELVQMRALQQGLQELPQRLVPRNFTLDPARYGRPQREPLVQAYPALRFATAVTALLFVVVLALDTLAPTGTPALTPLLTDQDMAASPPLDTSAVAEDAFETAQEAGASNGVTKQPQPEDIAPEEAPLPLEEAESAAALPPTATQTTAATAADIAAEEAAVPESDALELSRSVEETERQDAAAPDAPGAPGPAAGGVLPLWMVPLLGAILLLLLLLTWLARRRANL